MAKKDKPLQGSTIDGVAPLELDDSVERWHKVEDEQLVLKLEDAKGKPPTLENKIQEWRSLTDKQKRKKCLTRLKGAFLKPHKALARLRMIGDEIIEASADGVKPKWLQRSIDGYQRQLLKVEDAVQNAKELQEQYPDASEAAVPGGFEWNEDVPPLKNENDELVFLTSEGKMITSFKGGQS